MTITLPQPFITQIKITFGERGAAWLDDLPTLISEFAARWHLTVHPYFPNLSFNYVAPATRADGSPAVLKIGVPNRELITEMEALHLWGGRTSARLLESDPERGALLIERLNPGAMLSTLPDDDEATRIAAVLMRDLWTPLPPDHSFLPIPEWAAGLEKLRPHFDGGTGPFTPRTVDQAERLFAELLASSPPPMLLHGDLHQYNILSAGDGWKIIDPKGVAGDPAFEVYALMHNPFELATYPDLPQILSRRLDILAEVLPFDRARLLAWSQAMLVISAWWSVEDGSAGWESQVLIAEEVAQLT